MCNISATEEIVQAIFTENTNVSKQELIQFAPVVTHGTALQKNPLQHKKHFLHRPAWWKQ